MKGLLRVVVYVLALDPQEDGLVRWAGVGTSLRAAMGVITERARNRRYWVPEPGWCCDEIARGGR